MVYKKTDEECRIRKIFEDLASIVAGASRRFDKKEQYKLTFTEKFYLIPSVVMSIFSWEIRRAENLEDCLASGSVLLKSEKIGILAKENYEFNPYIGITQEEEDDIDDFRERIVDYLDSKARYNEFLSQEILEEVYVFDRHKVRV